MAAQAQRKSRPLDQKEADLYAEMHRLWDLGFNLIPLGLGDDGKSPATTFKGRARLPIQVVLNRMLKTNSLMYGIRLKNLVVVDLDTATPAAEEYIRRRFGESQVQVLTKRGRHHWWRIDKASVPGNVSEDGMAIDLKAGENSYVVGPKSVRMDGTVYEYAVGNMPRRTGLPPFVDRKPADRKEGSGRVGERHDFLKRKAVEYAWTCTDEEGLLGDLRGVRDWECDDPASVPDSELRSLAAWAWKKRLNNELWGGRESVVKMRRSVYDKLLKLPNGCEALGLYTVLLGAHGHLPGKIFAIVAEAMRRDGLIDLSEKKIWRARDMLLSEGLLIRARRRPGFQQPDQFQLGRGGGALPGGGGGSSPLH